MSGYLLKSVKGRCRRVQGAPVSESPPVCISSPGKTDIFLGVLASSFDTDSGMTVGTRPVRPQLPLESCDMVAWNPLSSKLAESGLRSTEAGLGGVRMPPRGKSEAPAAALAAAAAAYPFRGGSRMSSSRGMPSTAALLCTLKQVLLILDTFAAQQFKQ
jgi:hypothetical protein